MVLFHFTDIKLWNAYVAVEYGRWQLLVNAQGPQPYGQLSPSKIDYGGEQGPLAPLFQTPPPLVGSKGQLPFGLSGVGF